MSRLFLSHSSANNVEAVALRDWLAAEGWDDVFLDLDPDRGITAGERWERALTAAASRCEAVLFVISRDWVKSRWCLKEFNLAHKLNKRLFGVLVEDIPLADLPQDLTGAWQVVDLASGHDHIMLNVVLPRTHDETHVTFSREGLTRLKNGLARAGLDPKFFAWPPEHDPHRPPYRGLKPLEAEDAGIFFGRDAPIVEALDTMRGLQEGAAPRLLVILGASGAGKSSFLRAGLLPRLGRDERNFLPLPVLRPESAAISGENGLVNVVASALAAYGIAKSRAAVRDAVNAGADRLRELFTELVDKVGAQLIADESRRPSIVLAIDQAEELFQGEGAQEGQMLLTLIRDLVADDQPPLIALFAIRSDSYDRLETAKPLEGMRQQTLPLLPMPRGAYQTVIEGPAARLRDTDHPLSIEPRLTQRLLEDIETGGGSDALPLLAFTLEQLYLDYGGSGTLRLADYEAFGGVRGAIEAAVKRALAAADNDPRIPRDRDIRLALLHRGLVPWLAGIDPETGSPRRRIARLADIPAEALPLIQLLVEQRLLSTDRVIVRDGDNERSEVTIEPAHEALLRQWSLLHGWLEEDFAALTTLEAVKRAARDWAANARHADWLNHSGTRLEDAEKVAVRDDLAGDLSSDARDYLRQCREQENSVQRARLERLEREHEEQERRLRDAQTLAAANRRAAQRTGIGLAIALVLAALAGWQWFEADRAAREEKIQRDRAEQILRLAINETDSIVTKISTQLIDLVGISRNGIRTILTVIESQFDDMTKASAGAPRLQLSRAKMLSAFVDVFVELGELPEAKRRAEECVDIMRPLAPDDSRDLEMVEGLGFCLERLAYSQFWQGDYADAAETYRKSIALRRRIVAANPQSTRAKRSLAHVLNYGAVSYDRAAAPEAAAPMVKESLAITSDLIVKDPADALSRREHVESLNFKAQVAQSFGLLDEALTAFEQSRDVAAELFAQDTGNATLRRFYSNLLGNAASALMAVGRDQEALALLQKALEIKRDLVKLDPENVVWQSELGFTLSWLGEAERRLQNTNEAVAHYREAADLNKKLLVLGPDNFVRQLRVIESLIGLARARGTMNDPDAMQSIDEAIRLMPNSALAHNIRGLFYAERSNLDRAVADYTEAVRLDPKLTMAYLNRGHAYSAKKDHGAAIADFTAAINLHPTFAFPYFFRGNSQFETKNYDAAIADFTKAIELNPGYVFAYNSRGYTYATKSDYDRAIIDYGEAISLNPKFLFAYVNRGNAFFNKRDQDSAIADYTAAIKLNPKYVDAYNGRGNAHFNKREYDEAVADYSEAVKLNPKYATAYNSRGNVYYAMRDYDHAISDYAAAIESSPQSPSAGIWYLNRGMALFNKGEYIRATTDCDEAIRRDPNNAGAYFWRAFSFFRMHASERAIGDYDHAIAINPKYFLAYVNRGVAYRANGEYDRAITDLSRAIEIDPKAGRPLYHRGSVYRATGDAATAAAEYAAAIKLDPKDAGAYSAQCWMQLVADDAKSALANCEQSLTLRSDDPYAYDGRGRARLKLDQVDGALSDFDAALKIEPKLASSLFGRGTAKLRKGDSDGGNADIAAAKAIRPNVVDEFAP
jgi:tetratricopeptide (TPR) repeat protein